MTDEIDAALDATHRASLAKMIERQSRDVDENGEERVPTQFITTTFRPELIRAGSEFMPAHHNRVQELWHRFGLLLFLACHRMQQHQLI